MTTKQVVPDGMSVGVWSAGAYQPVYSVANNRMELPDRAGQPALPAYNGRVTIADDAVLDINFGGQMFNGWAVFAGNLFGTPGGMISFRAGGSSPTPFIEKVAETNTFDILNNTVLTGTSGADGAVTVSTPAGHLFIENRLGGERIWHVTVWGVVY